MSQKVSFPTYIFSPKELLDFKRRQQVAELLEVGETWERIKSRTGAHLQTIALVAKRLKSKKQNHIRIYGKSHRTNLFVFGQRQE